MRIGLNSPRAVLELLVRRRWWIIMPFVALTCLVAVLAKNLPKTYVSESMVQVPPRDVPENFVPDLTTGTTTERVKSIEQTVMSRTSLATIAREFGDKMPELRKLNMDERVAKLRAQIAIKYPTNPAKPSQQLPITYFRISFSNQDATLARDIAQKITQLFIAQDNKNRENQISGTKDFVAAELDKVSQDLHASEERVKQMKSAHMSELPDRLDTNQRTLENLYQNARSVEENLGKNAFQKLGYEQVLAETPPTLPSKPAGMPAAGGANNNAAPKAPAEDPKILEFRKVKQAYDDEAAKNPSQHPLVQKAKAQLDRARGKLSAEELEIAENPPVVAAPAPAPVVPGMPAGVEPNPAYQRLTELIRTAEADRTTLLNAKADINNRIAIYTRRVENTPQVESDLADIMREHATLQSRAAGLQKMLGEAELSVSLQNQQKDGQFTILDPANLPGDPTSKKGVIVLAGSGISLLFGLVLAVVVDIARQRIWSQSEIEAFWGVPVLVDIPEILTDADLIAARRRKWIFAASTAGAAMVYSVCLYAVQLKHVFILRQLNPVLQKFIN